MVLPTNKDINKIYIDYIFVKICICFLISYLLTDRENIDIEYIYIYFHKTNKWFFLYIDYNIHCIII